MEDESALSRECEIIELEEEAYRALKVVSVEITGLVTAVEASAGLSPPQKTQLVDEFATLQKWLEIDEENGVVPEKELQKVGSELGRITALLTECGVKSLAKEAEKLMHAVDAAAAQVGAAEDGNKDWNNRLLERELKSRPQDAKSTQPAAEHCASCGSVPASLRCTRCKVVCYCSKADPFCTNPNPRSGDDCSQSL